MASVAGPSSAVLSSSVGSTCSYINLHWLKGWSCCHGKLQTIPVPKNNKACSFNDHRPFALTSLVMKVLEKLVKSHIMSSTGHRPSPVWILY